MRLFRRKDAQGKATGPWIALYYDAQGNRLQRSTKCHDYRAAEIAAREFEREGADPTQARLRGATLNAALDLLLATRGEQAKAGVRSTETLRMYEQKCAPLKRLLGGETRLAALTAARVDAYISSRRAEHSDRAQTKHVSEHTIAKELVTLRAALKLAGRRGLYTGEVSAVLPIGFSPEYRAQTRSLSVGEVQKLLAQLPSDKAARVVFIVATGARWGETVRAQRADIGPSAIHLRGTKTALALRLVPVISATRDLLEYAAQHAQGVAPLLFQPWPNNVQRDLDRACERAGIPGCTPNDLRRTFATVLRERGAPVELLAPLMGHRDSKMVERVYGRLSVDALGERLEKALGAVHVATRNSKKSNRSDAAATRGSATLTLENKRVTQSEKVK